jgi:ribonuclease BN (tRNA processing enzyme)
VKLTVVGCASAYSTRPGRSSSAYLVEEGDTAVVFDLGQGSFSELWRYRSPATVAAVVISHMHADHNVDLIPLRLWAKYANDGRGPALYGPTHLRGRFADFQGPYGEPTTEIDYFHELAGGPLSEDAFQVGDLLVTPGRVTHIPDSFAFRVSLAGEDGPGFVYSGDCGVPDDLLPLIHPGDTVLCEAAFGLERQVAGVHMTAQEAGDVARRGGAERLILTHLLDRYDAAEMLDVASAAFGAMVQMAEPGMTLDIG